MASDQIGSTVAVVISKLSQRHKLWKSSQDSDRFSSKLWKTGLFNPEVTVKSCLQFSVT